jgi:DNA-directed RNA polymerase specialized sigma24 family protein
MSPATLRRYRAERLLERDFEALRSAVLAAVAARLRAAGAPLDPAELDGCYATAWQGLYAAALAGEEIANPRAWLVLVTYRRAIEELRTRRRGESQLSPTASVERDLDGELDDRDTLRRLVQGMRARLDLREREAAALCYLHGYSRGEAARQMGLSDTRMRKLMEGSKGRRGVSAKLGELIETIRDGAFCEQQGSLMRAFAFGVLDPEGERYRLAVMHRRDCSACRSYVASLRGVAVALPPVLTLPPGAGAGSLLGLAGLGHHAASGSAPASLPSLGASAATGGGASAGGSWALGSGLGAKLAAGCLLAVGIGAGCVAIERGAPGGRRPAVASRAPSVATRTRAAPSARAAAPVRVTMPHPGGHARSTAGAGRAVAPLPAREFSLEQPVSGPARSLPSTLATAAAAGSGSGRASAPAPGTSPGGAAREFSPG